MIQYDAPHPGEVVREHMDQMTVTDLAEHLGVTRVTLSRLLNGQAGVSAAMAMRLAQAWPNTDARFWLTLQMNYELGQAAMADTPKVKPLRAA